MKKQSINKMINTVVLGLLTIGMISPSAVALAETTKEGQQSSTTSEEVIEINEESESLSTETEGKLLTIIGTSDVHGNVWDWSYEDNKEADLGFAKIGTLVKEIRAENPNSILVDSGDTIQGTLLTDDLYSTNETYLKMNHPVITAMNTIGYDSMSLGNHEFNFGVPLIKKIEKEAEFPLLSANTYNKSDDTNLVKPYTVKEVDGVKVGILGLTIPHVVMWDKENAKDLYFTNLNEEAKKQVKIMKENENPDVIVAAIHAGLDNSDPGAAARTVIKEVPEIDAYVLGHDHREFAEKIVDNEGTSKPVAAVKDTGSGVVRIDLSLEKEAGKAEWKVVDSTPTTISAKGVPGDQEVKTATADAHKVTQEYVSSVVGTASADFLPKQEITGIPEALLQPTAMISLINNVQKEVTGADIAIGALFKEESKLNEGDITFANIFDIYKYPNTLVGTTITGSNLKSYLEKQAEFYQQYEEGDVNVAFSDGTRVYNYDIASGVTYKIDISKETGQRIKDLKYDGKEVADDQVFKIAMNNYRFEGMVKDGYVDANPYYESDPDTLRGKIVEYIKSKPNQTINPEDEIENSFEIIGTDFSSKDRQYVVEQINKGTVGFTDLIQSSADGRTPNVVKVTIKELKEAGLIPETTNDNVIPIQMLGVNDFHGAIDSSGTAYIENIPFKNSGKVINLGAHLDRAQTQFETANTDGSSVRIQAGDLVGASPANSALLMDEPTMKAFTTMKFDIGTLGNHEFDKGLPEFLRILEGGQPDRTKVGLEGVANELQWEAVKSYPRVKSSQEIVIANIENKVDNELGKTGEIPAGLEPYTIKEYKKGSDTVKVGYIGIITSEFPNLVLAQHTKDLTVLDEAEAIAKYSKELREEQDVNAIVVVSHVSSTSNNGVVAGDVAEMMKDVNKIYPENSVDVVFAGHNHQFTNGVIEREDGTGTRVVQSTSQGKAYIDLQGEIDVETGDFVEIPEAEVKATDAVPEAEQNAELKTMVDEANEKIKPIVGRKLATVNLETATKDDTGEYVISRGINEHNESALGNLITDAQLYMANNTNLVDDKGNKVKADFAITNNGGIRADLKMTQTGDVTWGDAQVVQPFGNILQVVKMTGKDLTAVLNEQFSGGNTSYALQISGLTYTYTGTAADGTFKITSVKDAEGNPLKDDANYNVIINDFLFGGGDGFKSFTKGQLVTAMDTDTNTFVSYFEKLTADNKKVDAPKVGRKTVKDVEVPVVKPQGEYISDGRYVKIVKKNYNIWSNFEWSQVKTTSTKELNKTYRAKGRYEHTNGATYFSLYDNSGKWIGYLNANATQIIEKPQGKYIAYGEYVTIKSPNYKLYSDFNQWKVKNESKKLVNQTYQAKGMYKHANGATYYSLYDNKNKWVGYLNKNATKVGKGKQGAYIPDGRYVQVSKNNFKIWNNFDWKKKSTTKANLNRTYIAKGRYEHFNGATYYSLYDSNGKWHGYLNANATKTVSARSGNYIKFGKKVTINKKGYTVWNNFSWKKRTTSNKLYNQTLTARGKYLHANGATYYSLYDNNGKWQGYINANAVKVK